MPVLESTARVAPNVDGGRKKKVSKPDNIDLLFTGPISGLLKSSRKKSKDKSRRTSVKKEASRVTFMAPSIQGEKVRLAQLCRCLGMFVTCQLLD